MAAKGGIVLELRGESVLAGGQVLGEVLGACLQRDGLGGLG